MRECDEELVPVGYYIEKNRASFPGSAYARAMHSFGGVTLTLGNKQQRSTLVKYDPVLSALQQRIESPQTAIKTAANAALSGQLSYGRLLLRHGTSKRSLMQGATRKWATFPFGCWSCW